MVILIPLFSLVCRSEGKTCGVCMEQVMAKLMRSERRFGIMCEGTRTVFLLMAACMATTSIISCLNLPTYNEKDGLVF